MEMTGPHRVCGNCMHGTTPRNHSVLIKSFKCDLGMHWVMFDERCDNHQFDGEEPPVTEEPKKKQSKSEAIDLGGIPASIKDSAKHERTA
jgi:hypothetical protein